jgi:calnexin
MRIAAPLWLVLSALCVYAEDVADAKAATSPAGAEGVEDLENSTVGDGAKTYTPPDESLTAPLHFVDSCDDIDSWTKPSGEQFTGAFVAETRQREALIGDKGLLISDEARKYGIAKKFPSGSIGGPMVIQYEVQFQDDLKCGGAYLKLFDSSQLANLADFGDSTRYVIMFGPDRCGQTNKVHFILQHLSPKTGKWEEKHLKKTVTPSFDKQSHVYTLVLSLKSRFEIFIDMESKIVGDLLKDMDPSVNPSKEIPDPTDLKPEDWVDNETIADPKDAKPAGWDDDAPKEILDPKDKKPYAWADDEPFEIQDPKAVKPAGWDDDEDGEWAPPMIPNPLCKPPGGCGEWKQKMIKNPDYKGVWAPKMIKNPDYKGKWNARTIPNPDFFEDKTPSDVPKFDAIGFEIWTMQSGIIFDNIVIAKNVGDAFAYAAATWRERKNIEHEWYKPPPKPVAPSVPFDLKREVMTFLKENGLDGWQGIAVFVLGGGLIYSFIFGGQSAPAPTPEATATPKEGAAEKNGTEEKEKTDAPKAEDKPKDGQPAEQSELRNRKAAGLNLNED